MTTRLKVLHILLVLACTPRLSAAQVPSTTEPDSAYAGPSISGRGAFLRSLAIPGWGQAYVGAPGRGAVYFALTSGSLFMSYVSRKQLLDARRELEWQRESGLVTTESDTEFVQARARHFEDWAALSIFLIFLSGADAYVSAYLADFDERIGVRPGADNSLRLELSIPTAVNR